MSRLNVPKADGTVTVREKDDFYRTPAWASRALFRTLSKSGYRSDVLDPAAGDGAILDVARDELDGPPTKGIEMDEERFLQASGKKHVMTHADALSCDWPSATLIVANPPFKHKMEFVEKAVEQLHRKDRLGRKMSLLAAFLLPVTFLATKGRAAFHREHPSSLLVLPQRPSFRDDGQTDMVEYGWFIWTEEGVFGAESAGGLFSPGMGTWRVLDLESLGCLPPKNKRKNKKENA